jgi:hypothetical protein
MRFKFHAGQAGVGPSLDDLPGLNPQTLEGAALCVAYRFPPVGTRATDGNAPSCCHVRSEWRTLRKSFPENQLLAVRTNMQILALDIAGTPFRWLDIERAITYAACGKVAWEVGGDEFVFHGGTRRDGRRSEITLRPVIALAKSEVMVRYLQPLPLGHDNTLLFRRDRETCAYCGGRFEHRALTRDHIVPKARGGRDTWTNVVTACRYCNMRKACRTPEEARMPLLYVPYEPCRFEHFILTGRRILADQMEYLAARLPRHSRLMLEGRCVAEGFFKGLHGR